MNKLEALQEENEAITIRMDNLQFCLDHCAESFDEQTKKLEAGLGIIAVWCDDCLKPKYACPSCIYQSIKEALGYEPRLSRGEQEVLGVE